MDSYLVLLQVGFTKPSRVTTDAVRSYRTLSPLPTEVGGLLSAALSVGSRLPGITWHPASRSPDFPLPLTRQRLSSQLRARVSTLEGRPSIDDTARAWIDR